METPKTAPAPRPLFRLTDAVLFLVPVLAAALYWLWNTGAAAPEAVIYQDGKAILTVDLRKDGTIVPNTCPAVQLVVQDGAIAFAASDCPDQSCVRTGFISHAGQTAVCLPNRLMICLEGGGAEPDAVAG